ncbi:MAG: copper resistance protein NlpE N-terminal domain-containing protein [Luteibaculaceae bacterium]
MKNLLFPTIFSLAIFATSCGTNEQANTKENTVNEKSQSTHELINFTGYYKGYLPCADCDGIVYAIWFIDDSNYEILYQHYKNDGVIENKNAGVYKLDENGIITLLNEEEPNLYKLFPNGLLKLDQNGEEIGGELADRYFLQSV